MARVDQSAFLRDQVSTNNSEYGVGFVPHALNKRMKTLHAIGFRGPDCQAIKRLKVRRLRGAGEQFQ